MPGYVLIEEGNLKPWKPNGLEPHGEALGFLDFLRELGGEAPAIPRFFQVRLNGLDEVLFALRPEEAAAALEIHRRLRAAAALLENRLASVQVVFRGKLVRGDTLWSEYRGQRLPISHIFGSPSPEQDGEGNRYYRASFNLTRGG